MFIFDSLPERSFLVTFLYALNFYFNYAELVASLLLNLNRASVVFLKARYQRFWAKALYPTFVIILFLSALLVLNSWFSDVSLQYIDPNDKEKGYDWTARKKIEWLRNSFILLGLLIAGAIGSLFSNIYVIFYLIVSRKNKQTFSENSNKDIQFRLFVFAGISFLIHVVYAFFQVCFFFFVLYTPFSQSLGPIYCNPRPQYYLFAYWHSSLRTRFHQSFTPMDTTIRLPPSPNSCFHKKIFK